jgi:hypothetical protein
MEKVITSVPFSLVEVENVNYRTNDNGQDNISFRESARDL